MDRYGPDVLAAPPAHGAGLVLWLLPAVVLVGTTGAAIWRGRRRGRGKAGGRSDEHPPSGTRDRSRRRRDRQLAGRRFPLVWNLAATAVVAGVVAVAVVGTLGGGDRPPPAVPADPVPGQLALARQLEQQGQFDAAAEVYRTVLASRPDDGVRLRLAFTLVRSGRPVEAAGLADQVLAARPDDPQSLLVLGLAQRATRSAAATDTLRRFLAVDPANPAAPEIRRLLDEG
ncbi:hypothetical protein GCM10027605_29140 [Micromonospora zhanjiangensis]